MSRPLQIFVSSGEPSGELYGGLLVRELRARLPAFEAFGLGGDELAAAGTRLLAHVRDLSVVGLFEVLRHIPRLRRIYRRTLDEIDAVRPDLAILIDYAGFNLRLARALKKRGVPIVYYVSPQVWAWRSGRIRTIRETVARMLVLFPFEPELYARHGVPVRFVGHPLVDRLKPAPDRGEARRGLSLDPARPLVSLLPGSRPQEVRYNLPPLLGAVPRLAQARPDVQFALAAAPNVSAAWMREQAAGLPITFIEGRSAAVLAASDLTLVASGTATVEAALCGAPMVVVYRLSPLTYRLGKPFVHVPHYAMVNLIAGRRLVPELIQGDFTPDRVVQEALPLLDAGSVRQNMEEGLGGVRKALGEPGASARAAGEVQEILSGLAK